MYILKISNKAFIKRKFGELILVQDPNEAEIFEKIGEAMSAAAIINETLGISIVKVINYK